MAGEASDKGTQSFHRGSGDGMYVHGKPMQHGKPCVVLGRAQQRGIGDNRTRPCRVTDRPVVPMKPGNAGGGKGPEFKVNV